MSDAKPPWGLGRTGLLVAAMGQMALALLALLRIFVDGEDHWWSWVAVLGCLLCAAMVLAQRRQLMR